MFSRKLWQSSSFETYAKFTQTVKNYTKFQLFTILVTRVFASIAVTIHIRIPQTAARPDNQSHVSASDSQMTERLSETTVFICLLSMAIYSHKLISRVHMIRFYDL